MGLALSLAFSDFSRARIGLECNVLVLDEVMQHLDVDGQAAMAKVLQRLPAETKLVIAHGLASDSLYGNFDAIDVVEKVGDVSRVVVGGGRGGAAAADDVLAEQVETVLPLELSDRSQLSG